MSLNGGLIWFSEIAHEFRLFTIGRQKRRICLISMTMLLLLLNVRYSRAESITMWHPWQQGARTVSELAAEYTRLTGVRVQVRALDSVGYDPWKGGDQPDIIGLSYPNRVTISRNARLGRLYNMQSLVLRGWYANFWRSPLETFTLRGQDAPASGEGIYGVPLTIYVRVLIYNPQLFKKAGVNAPRTWNDFLNASARLRRLGVIPLAGGLDGNYPGFPIMSEWSYLDSFNLLETYYGRYPYTGQRWQRQSIIYDEMRRYGVTNYTAASMNRRAAERYFINGKAAVIMDGPWFATVQRSAAPGFRDWRTLGPLVDSRAPFVPRYPGGVAEGAVINSRSKNKASAAQFLRWLTEPSQQIRLANSMNSLPASISASSSLRLKSDLRAFTPYVNFIAIELRYREKPNVLATLYGGARNVIRGRSTPSQVLSAAQRKKG